VVQFRGAERVFQPDARGGYFSSPHEQARLLNGGADADYILREGDGMEYHFVGGLLMKAQDKNGNQIIATHTSERLRQLAHSSGAVINLAYDATGRVSTLTDHRQRRTTFEYDGAKGTLAASTDSNGGRTTYSYRLDDGGAASLALTPVQRPNAIRSEFAYDTKGRLASHSLANGAQQVEHSYDSKGAVQATDGLGNTTSYKYDHLGIIARSTAPDGSSVTQIFDDRLNLVAEENESGNRRAYEYDSQGNLVKTIGRMGEVRELDYDRNHRLTSVTDATGRMKQVDYDAKGNLVSVTEPDGSTRHYERDGQGNIAAFTNARGQRIEMTYDDEGRVLSKTDPDGTRATFQYDARGRLLSTNSPDGTTTYEYDNGDRPSKVTYPGGESISYAYDAQGRRSSTTDHLGNTERIEYDQTGRVARVANGSNSTLVAYEYDSAGNVSRKAFKDGSSVSYDYHPTGQVSRERRHDNTGAMTANGMIEYGSSSRPISVTTNEGTRTIEWNANGQVTSEIYDPADNSTSPQTMAYNYDESGRLSRVVMNGEVSTYTTNARGDYTSAGNITFEHDTDGNVTKMTTLEGVTNYEYDAENHLIGATGPSIDWSQTIDPMGIVTEIREGSETYTLLHDPGRNITLASVFDSSGATILDPVYGKDFTFLDQPFINSPVIQPSLNGIWHDGLYPLNPLGIPSPATIQNLGELGYAAIQHPLTGILTDNPITNTLTDPWVGTFVGAGGLVNDLKYAGPFGKFFEAVGPPLGYFSGGVEVLKGAQTGDGNLLSHGVGTVAATGLATWLGGWATAAGVTLFGVAAAPVGAALGATVLVLDVGTNTGLFGELMYQFWYKEDLRGDRLKTKTAQSQDPNQKLGPAGYGDAHFVAPEALLPYRVDFENDKETLSPAQVVMITDPLSEDLDWATFELTEVGFGDHLIPVLGSSQSFEWVEPMTYLDKELEVAISIALDPVSGKIQAVFSATDKETGLPPEVQYGFLPPEDETGRGQGYFSYTITAKGDLPTGTEIRNIATIIFDFGEMIDTNQVDPHDPSKGTDSEKEALVTIDATAPSSSVAALSSNSGTSFTLSWSGQDGGGSGIGKYTVYVKDGNGSFEPWLNDTSITSSTFNGLNEHTYQFYSIARDHVGNEEPGKPNAEATTTVSGGADPYSGWLAEFFTNAEIEAGIVTAREADPDADGRSNEEEYAFISDPRSPDSRRIRANRIEGRFTLDYWRRTSGLFYETQSSTDLIHWLKETQASERVLETQGDAQQVRVTLPILGHEQFVCIQAEN
jgi:YD repeat-containing protein